MLMSSLFRRGGGGAFKELLSGLYRVSGEDMDRVRI